MPGAVVPDDAVRGGPADAAGPRLRWIRHPDRLVGFATFFPLGDRKLVELAGGLRTSEDALRQAGEFMQTLGKTFC